MYSFHIAEIGSILQDNLHLAGDVSSRAYNSTSALDTEAQLHMYLWRM